MAPRRRRRLGRRIHGHASWVTVIGYHASHEQHPPRRSARWRAGRCAGRLRRGVVVGSPVAVGSRPGPVGVCVVVAGGGHGGGAGAVRRRQRARPAVPPGDHRAGHRHSGRDVPEPPRVALGSGEASNEHVTGHRWPPKPERNARLAECVEVIRAAARRRGERRRPHPGRSRPALDIAAHSAAALRRGAQRADRGVVRRMADGLITVHMPPDRLSRLIEAFGAGGGEGKPVRVQVKVAWAPTDEEALAAPTTSGAPRVRLGAHGRYRDRRAVRGGGGPRPPRGCARSVLVSSDTKQHAAWLNEALDAGADDLFLHQVPRPAAVHRHVRRRGAAGVAAG